MSGEKVELTIKGDVERMTMGTDDFIVVTIDETVPESTSESIQKELASCVGVETSRVIVTSGGIKLSVMKGNSERSVS